MADPFAELLHFINRSYVIVDAQKDVDLNAEASAAAVIEVEKQRIVTDAVERAESLEAPFRSGLTLAFEAEGTGHPEIRLDDRDPQQNAIADALITFLVPFDLADSRSEETEQGHYDYFLTVKWDPLYRAAEAAGVNLPAALAQVASIPGG